MISFFPDLAFYFFFFSYPKNWRMKLSLNKKLQFVYSHTLLFQKKKVTNSSSSTGLQPRFCSPLRWLGKQGEGSFGLKIYFSTYFHLKIPPNSIKTSPTHLITLKSTKKRKSTKWKIFKLGLISFFKYA